MTKSNLSNVMHKDYSEVDALQQILTAAEDGVAELNYMLVNDVDYFINFTITIGHTTTALVLGAPQFNALQEFVKHIADENGYIVDYKAATVK